MGPQCGAWQEKIIGQNAVLHWTLRALHAARNCAIASPHAQNSDGRFQQFDAIHRQLRSPSRTGVRASRGRCAGRCSPRTGLLRFAAPWPNTNAQRVAPAQTCSRSSARGRWHLLTGEVAGEAKGKCNTPPACQRQATGRGRTLQHQLLVKRAHPDLNQGPADLQSAALTTELCTH